MIGKFENYIRNSGLEMMWVIRFILFSFVLQIISFLFLYSNEILFLNANFVLDYILFSNIKIIFYSLFLIAFIYSVSKNKGFSKILKSLFKLFFFMFFVNILYNGFSFKENIIIPNKYKNWDDFILIENLSDERERQISFIEKIMKKIMKN